MRLLGFEIRRRRPGRHRGPRGLINEAAVRRIAERHGKRVTAGYVCSLNESVEKLVERQLLGSGCVVDHDLISGSIATGALDETPLQEQPGSAGAEGDREAAEGRAGPVDQGRGCAD